MKEHTTQRLEHEVMMRVNQRLFERGLITESVYEYAKNEIQKLWSSEAETVCGK